MKKSIIFQLALFSASFLFFFSSHQTFAQTHPCVNPALINQNVACPAVYDPVCGCNGVTYGNACEAQNFGGVTSWSQGVCPQPGGCQAAFTFQISPNSLAVSFTNTSNVGGGLLPGFSVVWNFGDGHSSTILDPTHTFSAPGNYNVCLTINVPTSNGAMCTSIHCDTIRVGLAPPPCIDSTLINPNAGCFLVYAPVCGCNGVTYDNDCFARKNGVTHFTQGACQSSGNCQASFSFTLDNSGLGVQFNNTSLPNAPATNYTSHWNFGDGNSSTVRNPNHTYTAPGTYQVCLTISVPQSNGTACTNTYCASVTVAQNNLCIDTSRINLNLGCPMIYDPVCGCDGNTYGNSCVALNHHGVTQWTQGACGSSSQCQSGFTWTYGFVPPTIFFTDNSTGSPISSWHWNFGDGTTSTLQNPAHNYAQSGTYVVCLTVVCGVNTVGTPPYTSVFCDTIHHAAGCIDPHLIDTTTACPTVYQPVCGCDSVTYSNSCVAQKFHGVTHWTPGACQFSAPCQANFSFSPGLNSAPSNTNTFIFTDQSSGNPGSWQWDFGDGGTSNIQNPTHTYSQPGTYTVCLTISNHNNTCHDTICKTVVVYGCINPNLINPNFPCFNQYQPVCGCNNVTYQNGCIARYRHGVSSFTSGPCQSACQADYSWNYVSSGDEIHFTNNSTGNFTRVFWDFGDGSTSMLPNPVHLYQVAGWYKVCVTVSNPTNSIGTANNCFSTYCDSIYAYGCIDPVLIDPNVNCPTVLQPVCGCNGVTYPNACIAQNRHGITSFTYGSCHGPGYCPSQGLDSGRAWITRVGNHQTGDNGGYALFNHCHRQLNAGQTYIMRLQGATNQTTNFQAHWRLWADWNRDRDFDDPGELVWQGFGNLMQFAVFTVPNYACSGCTRLRFQLSDSFTDACGPYAVGETEDYDVTIISNVLCQNSPVIFNSGIIPKNTNENESSLFAEIYQPLQFSLFPNPAQDFTNIVLMAAENQERVTIRIFDISGREVYRQQIDDLRVNTTLQLSTSELSNGVYQVALQLENGFRQVEKLVITR